MDAHATAAVIIVRMNAATLAGRLWVSGSFFIGCDAGEAASFAEAFSMFSARASLLFSSIFFFLFNLVALAPDHLEVAGFVGVDLDLFPEVSCNGFYVTSGTVHITYPGVWQEFPGKIIYRNQI